MAHPLPSDVLSTCDGLVYCLSLWANQVTNGAFYPFLLLAFGLVLFMGTMRFGTPRAFGFASIMCAIGSAWLSTLQLMDWWIGSAFILAGAVGFVVLIMNER